MKDEDIQDELRALSPLLSEMKAKNDPKTVPDGYFQGLEAKVFQRLESEGARVHVQAAPSLWPRYLMAAAAAMALLLAAVWFLNGPNPVPPQTELASVDTLTPEMAEAYVSEHILDFEEDLLASGLDYEPEVEDSAPGNTALPASKTTNGKTPKDDLDEILDDLTEEELQELL